MVRLIVLCAAILLLVSINCYASSLTKDPDETELLNDWDKLIELMKLPEKSSTAVTNPIKEPVTMFVIVTTILSLALSGGSIITSVLPSVDLTRKIEELNTEIKILQNAINTNTNKLLVQKAKDDMRKDVQDPLENVIMAIERYDKTKASSSGNTTLLELQDKCRSYVPSSLLISFKNILNLNLKLEVEASDYRKDHWDMLYDFIEETSKQLGYAVGRCDSALNKITPDLNETIFNQVGNILSNVIDTRSKAEQLRKDSYWKDETLDKLVTTIVRSSSPPAGKLDEIDSYMYTNFFGLGYKFYSYGQIGGGIWDVGVNHTSTHWFWSKYYQQEDAFVGIYRQTRYVQPSYLLTYDDVFAGDICSFIIFNEVVALRDKIWNNILAKTSIVSGGLHVIFSDSRTEVKRNLVHMPVQFQTYDHYCGFWKYWRINAFYTYLTPEN